METVLGHKTSGDEMEVRYVLLYANIAKASHRNGKNGWHLDLTFSDFAIDADWVWYGTYPLRMYGERERTSVIRDNDVG